MDADYRDKVVLGTVYKASKKASIYGTLCLKELEILDIILFLKNYCPVELSDEQDKCLEEMALTILSKYPEICTYRIKNLNDKKFIT